MIEILTRKSGKWPHPASISRGITFGEIIAVSQSLTKDLMGNNLNFFKLQITKPYVTKHADQKCKIFDTTRHTSI